MRVLSLFDGVSCGRVALEREGIPLDCYHAAEIDKYAIQVSQKNWPDIVHLGDITKVKGELGSYDLIIGGSPCQGFSFAGKQLNFEDPRSKLFFEFVRLVREIQPKYFLLENVVMKQEYQDIISEQLGVEPILINSSLVSAQNRKRLYWANFPITQPEDRGILLKDIIEDGLVDRDKSYCIDANYFKGGNPEQYFSKARRQLVFNYSSSGRGNGVVEGRFTDADKALTLTASGYSNRSFTGVIQRPRGFNKGNIFVEKSPTLSSNSWEQNNHILYSDLSFRKLTPIECERLQTLPDGYTEGISNTQRYKSLGNGWTVDVIAHIFKCLKETINA